MIEASPAGDLPGLSAAPLSGWLAQAGLTAPWTAEVISGGLSNITYRLRVGDRHLILRRPPLGGVLATAHDMAREYKVLAALGGTPVPVPQVLAYCADPDVIGAPFYLMDEVHGEVLRTAQDCAGLTAAQREQITDELARVLAAIHAVEPGEVGLADFGRPDGYNTRQLRRWGGQWQATPGADSADMDLLLARLGEHVGELPGYRTSVVHGDFRLDNTLLELGDPTRVVGVLDWELSTLGDPLADLGVCMTYWDGVGGAGEDGGGLGAVWPLTAAGFPDSLTFAQRYAAAAGADLEHLRFYRALGAMKLGVIAAGVAARFRAGHTVSAGYEGADRGVPALAARGLALLAGDG